MAVIQALGIASSLGGPHNPHSNAAELIRDHLRYYATELKQPQLQWHMVYPKRNRTKDAELQRLNQRISQYTRYWAQSNTPFLAIDGDHSCAMGIWSGVLQSLKKDQRFGLIWLDAHMDAHTFCTSPTQNIHGMPIAALLGTTDKQLAHLYPGNKFIKPENLVLMGIRSFEAQEYKLLKTRGIKIIFSDRINDFSQNLLSVAQQLSLKTEVMGISIDMDFIEPLEAPGVATPVAHGIKAQELINALKLIRHWPKVVGLELSEYYPQSDQKNKTLELMEKIIFTFYNCKTP
jgi:arginase